MLAAAAALALCMMTGCAGASESTETTTTTTTAASTATAEGEAASASAGNLSGQQAVNAEAKEASFSERDMEQTADTSDAKSITVRDGEIIDINEEGVYVISGTAANCTIRIEADKTNKVQLVLDGVSVTNTDFPVIYVVNADKCFITTAEGSENTLAVTGAYRADGETNTDAVIFAKDDIVFNGLGKLTISTTEDNGISCKNDIKFTGGTYDITCAEDAVEAKDMIAVCGGSFTIKTDKDGFHAEDSDDATKGSVAVSGGTFDITAKSDGIQGTTFVRIDGGEIAIDASEGIEAAYVLINDGTINIKASDDGINASSGSAGSQNGFGNINTDGICIEFNGGTTTIDMAAGDTDGVDSNGSLIITGGTISVNTQGNAFDYENEPVFTGGTILVNGEEKTEVPQDMMGGGFGGGKGGFGGKRPDFNGEMPEGFEPPEGFDGERPEFNGEMPEGFEPPEGFEGFKGKGGRPGSKDSSSETAGETTSDT